MTISSLEIRLIGVAHFAQAGIHIGHSREGIRRWKAALRDRPGPMGRVTGATVDLILVAQRQFGWDCNLLRRFYECIVIVTLPHLIA